jgi:cytochrome c oxidase cbb3-type subunit 3
MKLNLIILVSVIALAGCDQQPSSGIGGSAKATMAPNLVLVPSGDIAGSAQSSAAASINNPLEGQPAAVVDGKRLFVQMNCAGCHGYDLGGAMGPNLKDKYWRYGGSPAAIYRSIASGHPQGMPAWSEALPPDQIWKLVAYIKTYGGSVPAADYQGALQGDYAATSNSPGGTGVQGAKGDAAPTAQPANP